MKDKEFLKWIITRLAGAGHSADGPAIKLLTAIAERTPDDQITPINFEASIEDKIAVLRMKYVGTGSGADLLDLIEALNKRVEQMANDISVVKGTQQRLCGG